jgi:hypothetical protein
VLAFVLYRRTSPTLPFRLRIFLGMLRWIAALLVLLLVTDPALRWMREKYTRPSIAVLIDDSRSMGHPDAAAKFDRIKANLSRRFIGALEEKADLRFFTFSDRTMEASPEELQMLEANGSRTDLADGLKSATEIMSGKPSAFVVFSDGAANFGEDVLHFATTLRIPVHTVSLAMGQPTPDVSIDAIDVNETAYANSDVAVGIVMSGRHSGEIEAKLTIEDSTGTVFSRPVVLPGAGAKTRIGAEVNAGEVGLHEFRVILSPLEGESVTANNTAPFSIDVIKGRIRVCLIASSPSWDFAFGRRTLRADPNIDVSSFFTTEELRRLKLDGAIGDLGKALPDLDVAVLFDDAIPASIAQDLEDFVWNGGGALFIAHAPTAGSGSEMNPFGASPDLRRGGELYSPALTEAGMSHEILRLEDADASFSWPGLPPVPVSRGIGGVRKEATVLLSAVSGDTVVPLFAVMKHGRGRVAGFSAFELWRWDFIPKGFGAQTSPFGGLLLNSVGWLAEEEEAKRLSISSSRNIYSRGEPVALSAQVTDQNLKPLDNALLEGVIADRESGEVIEEFVMVDRGGGNHSARLDLLPPSPYTVRVRAMVDGEPYSEENLDFTVAERGLEDNAFDGDRTLLEQLAGATGGAFYSIEDVDRLASDLNPGMIIVKSFKEFRLRLTLPTFLVLLGLLGLEWFIRKRRMLI